MKKVLLGLIALGSIVASSAAAQTPHISLGAGGVMPSGDYGTLDNVGWNFLGALEVGLPKLPIAVRADFIYGQTTHGEDFLAGNTKLSGVSADAVYHIGASGIPIKLYLLAGVGYYHVSIDGASDSETKPSYNAGTGLTFGVGPMKLFAEARYISVLTSGSALTFFPVNLGFVFGM